ncbi:hypothetical protein ACVWYN_000437 [Pedobacter sp. UYP24]
MSTKRLKPSDEQGLIAQIKEGLSGYEEEYVPGAWENFQKKEGNKRGLVFWMSGLSGIAALLLLSIGVFLYVQKEDKIPVDAIQSANSATKIEKAMPDSKNRPEGKKSLKVLDHFVGDNNSQTAKNTYSKNSRANKNSIQENEPVKPLINTGSSMVNNQIAVTKVPEIQKDPLVIIEKTPAVVQTEKKVKGIMLDEFLAKENASNNQAKTKPAAINKWDLGVVLAPSIGNSKKLNMGYGMSMAYHISKRVSVSSGLSYNEMDASKEIGTGGQHYDSPSSSAFVSDSKSLEAVSTQVTGIDIPLDFKYKLSKRFYANVGISAFAVINQKQSNTYQQSRVQQSTTVSPSGDVRQQSYLLTEKITESADPAEVSKRNLIGFYNFSFGYQQKVSKDKFIGIEPFIKVPMKDLSKENLRLMGTGLKIRFDF